LALCQTHSKPWYVVYHIFSHYCNQNWLVAIDVHVHTCPLPTTKFINICVSLGDDYRNHWSMCRSPRAGIVWRSPKMVVSQIIQNSISLSLKTYDIGDAPFWEITIMIETFSVLTRHVTEFEILNFIHEDSASIWRVSIRVCRILWKTVPKISTL
jgi:hypothetical protein